MSHRPPATITRRDFIYRVSRYGGAAAMTAMLGLDLMAKEIPKKPLLTGRARAGKNRVVILGAGLAGMCAAHELGKLGYECTILEPRQRAGGRCWTIRRGDRETEVGGAEQVCRFDRGSFMNPGPTRIPGHHEITLDYCKEFNVPLQVFTNVNESAYLHRDGFPLMRWRDAKADYRGYTGELLAKATNKGALDRPFTAEDRDKLIAYLRDEGGLNTDLHYAGGATSSSGPGGEAVRRSFKQAPGAGDQPPIVTSPVDLEMLIKSGFGGMVSNYYDIDQSPTMLTPVGGIDQIAKAFESRVRRRIRFGAEVREIRKTADGRVMIAYTDARGARLEANADFCICTIPPVVLEKIPADFSKPFAEGIAAIGSFPVGKIGLQFKRRFWEQDDRIFGGISRTAQPITQIIYPFDNYHGKTGVLIGYYNFGPDAAVFGAWPPAERERMALEQGAKIHPQYKEEFDNSFSVDWQRIRHNRSGWAGWSGDSRERYYKALNEPDGPIWLCGEGMSYIGGWMAGAFVSAHKVCQEIHARATAA